MIYTFENEPGNVLMFGEGATPFQAAQLHGYRTHQMIPQHWETHGQIAAYINHSKWIAQCPNCNSAMAASKIHPEFHCLQCHNPENDGQPYAVVFPLDAEQIEALLVKRPDPTTRNWRPGESVARLQLENEAHGL